MAFANPQTSKQFGYVRLLFMGLLSVALCMSMFMTVIAPLPLAFVTVAYGRIKGLLLGLGCSLLAWFWGSDANTGHVLFLVYILSWMISIVISEVILRKIKPMNGLLRGGLVVLAIVGIVVAASITQIDRPVKVFLTDKVAEISSEIVKNKDKLFPDQGENYRKLFELLSRPELVAAEVIRIFPSYVVIGIFFTFWLNIMLLIKSMRVNYTGHHYPFSEKDVLSFRMPDFFVWPTIAALALYLVGDMVGAGEIVNTIAVTAVHILGLFYFFQGVGIYMEFLKFLRMGNFIKSFLMILMVVTIPWVLAVIGLFEMWIDFRGIMKKKLKKNDK